VLVAVSVATAGTVTSVDAKSRKVPTITDCEYILYPL